MFAVAFENWIGPGYLGGMAGELGLRLSVVSVIAAIPWIGAGGQILGLWLSQRSPSVRRYVLGLAAIGRGVWLVPFLFAAVGGGRSYFVGVAFPTASWFAVAAVCACLSSLLTAASANAWMAWMKNLIPHSFLGRFFGGRQRHTTAAFVVASLVAATLVDWKPGGYWLGFGLMAFLALVAGTLSLVLHSRVPDVRWEEGDPAAAGMRPASFRERVLEPLRDPDFRSLMFLGAAFHGCVQLSGSYLPYFFTHELGVSLSSLALWGALANAGCFLSARAWGAKADRSESLHGILWRVGHVVAFAPLVYFGVDSENVRWIAPVEHFFNGMVWAGFTLAQTKILMRTIPRGKGTAYFSVFAASIGVGGAVSTFLGGQLAQLLAPWGGLRALWVVSSAGRIAVLWLLCRRHVARQDRVLVGASVVDVRRAVGRRIARVRGA